MPGDQEKVQPKAWAIADELIACGRASRPVPVRGYLCLRAESAGYYWVANDGERVVRGINIDSATVIFDPAQSAATLRMDSDGEIACDMIRMISNS